MMLLAVTLTAIVLDRRGGPCIPTHAQECACLATEDEPEVATEYSEAEFTHDGRTSPYRVYDSGIDPEQPVGLLIRLHGDGGYEFDEAQRFMACLAAQANSHNLIVVNPRTPSADLTWWTEIRPNTAWLKSLHHFLLVDYPEIDKDSVWWMGYSGGAEIITYGLLPTETGIVSGGAIMIGGGGAPTWDADIVATPEQRRSLPLIWSTGRYDTGDDPAADFDALTAASRGSLFYRQQGFQRVTMDFMREADHFTIDQINVLADTLHRERKTD